MAILVPMYDDVFISEAFVAATMSCVDKDIESASALLLGIRHAFHSQLSSVRHQH
jgi:hypothetical protein